MRTISLPILCLLTMLPGGCVPARVFDATNDWKVVVAPSTGGRGFTVTDSTVDGKTRSHLNIKETPEGLSLDLRASSSPDDIALANANASKIDYAQIQLQGFQSGLQFANGVLNLAAGKFGGGGGAPLVFQPVPIVGPPAPVSSTHAPATMPGSPAGATINPTPDVGTSWLPTDLLQRQSVNMQAAMRLSAAGTWGSGFPTATPDQVARFNGGLMMLSEFLGLVGGNWFADPRVLDIPAAHKP